MERAVGTNETTRRELALDMRYAGQEHTLTVAVPEGTPGLADVEALRERFRAEYESTFALRMDADIQVVVVRAAVRTPLPRGEAAFGGGDGREDTDPARPTTSAWSFRSEAFEDFRLVQRESLPVGAEVHGPAIVLEETATSYVDRGFSGVVDPSGCLLITDTEA
jgi:N-methylhydantoinase A